VKQTFSLGKLIRAANTPCIEQLAGYSHSVAIAEYWSSIYSDCEWTRHRTGMQKRGLTCGRLTARTRNGRILTAELNWRSPSVVSSIEPAMRSHSTLLEIQIHRLRHCRTDAPTVLLAVGPAYLLSMRKNTLFGGWPAPLANRLARWVAGRPTGQQEVDDEVSSEVVAVDWPTNRICWGWAPNSSVLGTVLPYKIMQPSTHRL
jgi:hypothetical protein